MARILVILSNPRPDTLGEHAALAYADAARQAGATVDVLALRDLAFDPILRGSEQALEPDLCAARAAIEAADHLVFQFPLWWAAPPALLRGFIDRTFLSGWAFRNTGGALPEGLLAGRTARLIVTMDSPWWWYRVAYGRAAHRAMATATLWYCGVRRIRETTIYRVRALDDAARAAAIARTARAGAADA